MAYLLDTNALSEFFKKEPNEFVIRWFTQTDEQSQFISVFSIGELQKGISKLVASRRKKEMQDWFDRMRSRYNGRILAFEVNTAMVWGKLLIDVARSGRKLPVIDSLIAATAVEHGLTIVTRNVKDFDPSGAATLNIWE